MSCFMLSSHRAAGSASAVNQQPRINFAIWHFDQCIWPGKYSSTGPSDAYNRRRSTFNTGPSTLSLRYSAFNTGHGGADLAQELGIVLGLLEFVQHELDSLLGIQSRKNTAQLPYDHELVLGHQQLFAPRARGIDINGREDPLIGQLATQPQFHIARALELLEDHFIHPRAGLDQCRGQDG